MSNQKLESQGDKMQKRLILTVGLPRSGKSTWAKQQNVPIVNPDSIRLAIHGQRFIAQTEPFVWVIAFYMAEALFLAGHNIVIVDATNTTFERRQAWIEKFVNINLCVKCKLFETTKEECISRALKNKDEEIIPVIERMASKFDKPQDYECLEELNDE